MTTDNLLSNVSELLDRVVAAGGIVAAMRESEEGAGNRVVLPDSVPWLPSKDWGNHPIISIRGRDVRIVAICALNPWTGAFSRLIDGIIEAGMTPVIVAPMLMMPEILERWGGWFAVEIGEGWSHETHMRPTGGWMRARLKEARRRKKARNGNGG